MRIKIYIIISMLAVTLSCSSSMMSIGEEPNTLTEEYRYHDHHEAIFKDHHFIQNSGQWDESLLFIGETSFGHVGFTKNGMLYHVLSPEMDDVPTRDEGYLPFKEPERYETITNHVMKVEFVDPNPIIPMGISRIDQDFYFRYGYVSDEMFHSHGYRSVNYINIWEGIDIQFHFLENDLKYDITVHPGADPQRIRFRVDGADQIELEDRSVRFGFDDGSYLIEEIPLAYVKDDMREVGCEYRMEYDGSFSISVIGEYPDETIIIDPMIYSTYVGGFFNDVGYGIQIDASDNAYVAGYSGSLDFPTTPGAYSTYLTGWRDVIVIKVNSSGRALDFSTYIGGNLDDEANGIILDEKNTIYITGFTCSSNFPVTKGCYDETYNKNSSSWRSADVFVLKLSSDGSKLLASTYLGGEGNDEGYSIDMDDYGNIYVTGYSEGSGFPTTNNSYDRTYNGERDIFVSVLSNDCSTLKYSTFIGGTDGEAGWAIRHISPDEVVVVGGTNSNDFPVHNALYKTKSSAWYAGDCFVLRLNISSSKMVFSTYLGGSTGQLAYCIDINEIGNIYVAGETASYNFPVTPGAYDTSLNSQNSTHNDVFLTVFNHNGSKLIYSTFIGGDRGEYARSILLDESNNVYITGSTSSSDFPIVKGSYCTRNQGENDCFVLKMNITNNELLYSSYIGGNKRDIGTGIQLNQLKEVFVTGYTESTNFPTTNETFNKTLSGDLDIFVFHLNLSLRPAPPQNLTGTMGMGYIHLKWEEPESDGDSPIFGYNVYRGYSEGLQTTLISLGDVREFNDTSILNDRGYYYYVTAENIVGESDPSNTLYLIDNRSPYLIEDLSFPYATTGDIYNFSVVVEDDIKVKGVGVEYRINDGPGTNLSMNSIQDERWNLSITIPDRIGNLSYVFYAYDPTYNFNTTDIRRIEIIDNDGPVFGTDHTTKHGTTGDMFNFSIEIKDNIGINETRCHYRFDDDTEYRTMGLYRDGGAWNNRTRIPHAASSLEYYFTAEDTSGNRNATTPKKVPVIDNDLPTLITDLSDEIAYTSDVFHFRVMVEDNIEILEVDVSIHRDGTTADIPLEPSDDVWAAGVRMTEKPGTFVYEFHFSDTTGNRNVSVPKEIMILDNDPPGIIEDRSDTEGTTGDQFDFALIVADNDAISEVKVEYWFTGEDPREIIMLYSGEWVTFIQIPKDSLLDLNYVFHVTDVSGNRNSTEIRTVRILDDDKPEIDEIWHSDHPIGTGDTYLIEVSASDNIGISRVTLHWKQDLDGYIEADLEEEGSGYTTTLEIPVDTVTPISYHMVVSDLAGNERTSYEIKVEIIDTIAPTIEQVEEIFATPSTDIDIVLDVDDNIDVTDVRWEGAPFAPVDNSFHERIDLVGIYTVVVTVRDGQGNSASMTFNISIAPDDVTVDDDDQPSNREYLWLWLLLSAIFVASIPVILIVLAVRRKKSLPETPSEDNAED